MKMFLEFKYNGGLKRDEHGALRWNQAIGIRE